MASFIKNGVTNTCEYDANGIRIKKVANGLSHEYYLEDKRIVREVVTGTSAYELYYMYGTNGIVGFTHKTSTGSTNYYFRKNLQGDIVAVYGENGTKYAEYAYDAWGNCTILSNTSGIGTLNPFRYRGYYWDEEIKLYYLNARYYDPEVGRFISQDSIKYIAPETLNGINLFAYCLNNPVMGYDPDGTTEWWEWLIAGTIVAGLVVAAVAATVFTGGLAAAALTGAAIGAGISLGSQAISGELNWGQFLLDTGVGALTGMIGASGISRVGSMFVGAGIGGISNIASQLLGGKSFTEINWLTVGVSVAVGGIAGLISGAGAKNMKSFQNGLGKNAGWNKAMSSFYKVQSNTAAGMYTKAGAAGAKTLVNNMLSQAYVSALDQFGKQAIKKALIVYASSTGPLAFTFAILNQCGVGIFA